MKFSLGSEMTVARWSAKCPQTL